MAELNTGTMSAVDRPLLGYALNWLVDLKSYTSKTKKRTYPVNHMHTSLHFIDPEMICFSAYTVILSGF